MYNVIESLRYCGNYEDREGCAEECPYFYDRDCPKRIMADAADAIERLVAEREKMRDQLILNICSHCDSHIKYCGECPIIKDINEVFNEQ